MTMKIALLSVVLAFSCRGFGANDWTTACIGGRCSFDVEESPNSMGGSIQISGSPSSISDITPAAGWQILDCTSSTNNQVIRLVCTDESLSCDHVFQDGAQDTIVRLPEGCGSGPFVRVANHSIDEDQSLPENIASKLRRRDGSNPQVHMLQIDDNFGQSSGSHGNVSFEIHAQGDLRVTNGPKQRSKRQNGSGSVFDVVNDPEQSFTVFNTNLMCPAVNDTTQMLAMFTEVFIFQAQFNTTINITSTGTISPPNIDSLSFSAPMDGALEIEATFESGLQGSLEAAGFPLENMEFPSFSIGGILEINPSFIASGDATVVAELLSNFLALTSFSANINSLQFTYPSNDPPPSVNITIPIAPFDVLALPTANSTSQFTFSAVFEHLVEVSAFSQSVELSVAYNYSNDVQLDSTPSTGNNEQVCVNITNSLVVAVSNNDPFFDAFSEVNAQTIFSDVIPILSTCQVLALEPSPEVAHSTKSTLTSRDGVSCPPIAALPQTSIYILA